MSLVQRNITLIFELGKGSFGESGFNTVTLAGYRCSVEIERGGLPFVSTSTVRVSGISQSLMNQLSTLGGNPYFAGRLNQVTVLAGDEDACMFQIYQGTITNGYQDYDNMPEVSFVAEAFPGAQDNVKPSAATTFPGAVSVATILEGMAASMTPPLAFNNNGVNQVFSTPYYSGTMLDQIRAVITHANINGEIDRGTLYIWPRNGNRAGDPTTISPTNGLVGYPSINGVQVFSTRSLFNSTIEHGAMVNLQSSLQPACGTWYCNYLTHNLESQTPGGAWFTDLSLCSKDYILSQPSS